MSANYVTLADNLLYLSEELGAVSRADLARAMRCSVQNVGQFITGRTKSTSAAGLVDVAELVGIPAEALMTVNLRDNPGVIAAAGTARTFSIQEDLPAYGDYATVLRRAIALATRIYQAATAQQIHAEAIDLLERTLDLALSRPSRRG